MKILNLEDIDPEILRPIYRETTADVPYCFPVSCDEFKEGLLAPLQQLDNQKLVLGQLDGAIVGFAHIALSKQDGQPGLNGSIRFLGYRKGNRPIAQSILESAEKYLFDLGIEHIDVPAHNYAFYRFNFGPLSDKMAHICALLGINGYEPTGGWLLMELADYQIEKPIPLAHRIEIAAEVEDTNHRHPNITIRLLRAGNQIGLCEASPAGRFHADPSAQDTFYIGWMEVTESERGRRLGRFLLEATLWEMQNRGYNNAVLHTNCGNRRAQLLYAGMGFKVLDTSYEFRKPRPDHRIPQASQAKTP
ncbi:MAG: GNAT family N-acetyltransferase [Candidatus Latescibacteria bacterium]|nr:GNAT family N-acetyltransferase [Candidatus Latescibacterota bacterium]